MNGQEKSDAAKVAVKPSNKVGKPAAESVERRAGTEGKALSKARAGHSTGLRVRQALKAYAQSGVYTQGGSRMREFRLYGSVRGALSNERPYRDP